MGERREERGEEKRGRVREIKIWTPGLGKGNALETRSTKEERGRKRKTRRNTDKREGEGTKEFQRILTIFVKKKA